MKKNSITFSLIYVFIILILPQSVLGQTNSCLQFDGIDDWVEIPETSDLDITTNLSVSIWAKTEDNITAKIIEKETWNSGWTIGQDKWNGWKVGFIGTSGGYSINWGDGIPVYNQWYQITMTFDGTTLKLYVDGILKNSTSTVGTIKLNNEPVSLGADKGGQKFFEGCIDETAIWNTALTASQITDLKDDYIDINNLPSGLVASQLIMYHSLDESQGENEVFDSSTNGIDGFLRNMDANTDRLASSIFDNDNQNLPIELIEFSCQTEDQYIEISWTTVSETNNDYFTIERSEDGIHFTKLTTINGAGNSNCITNYQFIDNDIQSTNYYYRLKQTDFDGNYTYSSAEYVQFNQTVGIKIYPNPTVDYVNISADNEELEMLHIYNSMGQDITTNVSIQINDKQAMLDLSNSETGYYFIQTKSKTYKILKTK